MEPSGVQARHPEADVSPVTLAIDLTLRTIEARTKLYRGLVVTVTITSLAAMLAAVLLCSWTPLFALILLVPFAGGYLLLDSRRVTRWRSGLLDLWRDRDLKLEAFAKCISAYPSVPPRTLEGMFAVLPKSYQEPVAKASNPEDKQEVIRLAAAAASQQERRTLLVVVTLTLAAGLLAGGLHLRSTRTLAAGALVAVLAGILKAQF